MWTILDEEIALSDCDVYRYEAVLVLKEYFVCSSVSRILLKLYMDPKHQHCVANLLLATILTWLPILMAKRAVFGHLITSFTTRRSSVLFSSPAEPQREF